MRMEGNLMLERQPPIGGVGPPPPPTGSRGGPPPREYQPFYKFPSAASVQASNPNSNVNSIQRSPRLLITPSSPDNVGPALGRLGRSIGLSVEMLATVGKCIRLKKLFLIFCLIAASVFNDQKEVQSLL